MTTPPGVLDIETTTLSPEVVAGALVDASTTAAALPQVPGLDFMRTLYRETDDFIGVGWRDPLPKLGSTGTWELRPRVAISVRALYEPDLFGVLAKTLPQADVFIGLGTFDRAGAEQRNFPGFRWPLMRESRLEHLCALDLDLDGYKAGLSAERVEAMLGEAVEAGILPPASLHLFSGRGLHAIYILHDEADPTRPPKATFSARAAWRDVTLELGRRFTSIAKDDEIFDNNHTSPAPGFLPLPGTKKTRGGRVVAAKRIYLPNGKMPSYSLLQLCQTLRLRVPYLLLTPELKALADRQRYQRAALPGSCPARRRGPIERDARRARDLVRVAEWRGGFREGERHNGLWLLAQFLRGSGVNISVAIGQVGRIANLSRYTEEKYTDIVRDVFASHRPLRWRTSTICARLAITERLADEIGLESLRPLPRPKGPTVPKSAYVKQRRDFIKSVITKGNVPTLGAIREKCRAVGISISLASLSADLYSLGLAAAGMGRPRKATQPALFPDPKSQGFTTIAVLPKK